MDAEARHSCLKLHLPDLTEPIFVKAAFFDTHFHLDITDGFHAWICEASEEEVKERAAQWDQPVSEYIELAEKYLGFQQSGSVYKFTDADLGHRRLSWTFEKGGMKLEWRWKCKPSPNPKKTTSGILDFLMDANIRLSDEVVSKTKSFERLKAEAENCLAQSEKFNSEKVEFESAIYAKFLGVLNSKKAKLRELRDQLGKQGASRKLPDEDEEDYEEDSTEKTETFSEGSDNDKSKEEITKNVAGTSECVPKGRGRGRKRGQSRIG